MHIDIIRLIEVKKDNEDENWWKNKISNIKGIFV
jgi:hypothetical protein